MDDGGHGLDLRLHEEAHAVEDLDVGLYVVAVFVGVDDELGHVGGQAGDEACVPDHLGVVVQAADLPQVFVYQLLGAGVVDEAESGPPAGRGLYLVLRLPAALGGVVHVQVGGVDADDLPTQLLLGLVQGADQVGGIAQGRHDGVYPMAEVGLQHGLEGLGAVIAAADHLVGGGAGVAPSQQPVGADEQTGEGDPSHGGAGKFVHNKSLLCERIRWDDRMPGGAEKEAVS